MIYGYINIYDLLFNGAEGCELLEEKPKDSYIALWYDTNANCGRGEAAILYKGKAILSHCMTPCGVPAWDESATRVTIGDLKVASSVIMRKGIEAFLRYGMENR